MVVSVTFFGLQRKLAQTGSINLPLLKEMRVTDVFNYIREKYPELSLSKENVLVTVNNQVSLHDRILESEDRICFIPHIGGG